jgi:hypothetical protein
MLRGPAHPVANAQTAGFTVLEAVVASALLAFGLAGAMRLSLASLATSQVSRHIDVASGLAQDLAECWGLQSPRCQSLFTQSGTLHPVSTDPALEFVRTWQVINLPVAGMSSDALQELRISVFWQEPTGTRHLQWHHRRASTPLWVSR